MPADNQTPGKGQLVLASSQAVVMAPAGPLERARMEAEAERARGALRAIRCAANVRERAIVLRALQAAEAAAFELQCKAEATRYELLNRTQAALASDFVAQLDRIDALRPKLPPEIIDALKERAFTEFTTSMKRVSKPVAPVEGPEGGSR